MKYLYEVYVSYKLFHFADIDECNTFVEDACSQVCINNEGSFSCACNDGYETSDSNPHKCNSKF